MNETGCMGCVGMGVLFLPHVLPCAPVIPLQARHSTWSTIQGRKETAYSRWSEKKKRCPRYQPQGFSLQKLEEQQNTFAWQEHGIPQLLLLVSLQGPSAQVVGVLRAENGAQAFQCCVSFPTRAP